MASPTRWIWIWTSSLACCSPWGHKESDTTEWLNWTELRWQFWVNFCMKCKVSGDFHFFAYDCSRDLAPFVEKDYPSTFGLPLLVITQLSICLWVYSWVLYSVLLIYMSVSLPLSHCLEYSNYVLSITLSRVT